MPNPFQQYDQGMKAYLRAQELLANDQFDIEEGRQLFTILNSDNLGLRILRKEKGSELEALLFNLCSSKIQSPNNSQSTVTDRILDECSHWYGERTQLVSLQGPLIETFSQLDPATIQHADQLTTARRTNKELRNQWLWTADGPLYTMGGPTVEDAYFHLTRGPDNVVFKNIREAVRQLCSSGNYRLEAGHPDLEAALNSPATLTTRMADLNLQGSGEWLNFRFDTEHYQKRSNDAQKVVIERVYSEEGVQVLRDNGIKQSQVYLLNPEYVIKQVPQNGALARACWLNYFDGNSIFGAVGRSVDGPYGRLCGVPRKEIAAGDDDSHS